MTLSEPRLLAELAAALGLGGAKQKQEGQAVTDEYPEFTATNQRIRDTAKWVLTSFAAVGAILVAGLQLSSIGKLSSESSTARIAATFIGVAAAALGVGIAIWATSNVLAPFLNSFRTADKHSDVTDRVLGDKELIGRTYTELKQAVSDADAALDEALEKGRDSPEYKHALAERDDLETDKQLALTVIGSELLADRFAKAKKAIVAGIVVVIGGVVAFAWGANPPSPEARAAPVALGQAPLLLNVHLTPGGVAALERARSCKTADLAVLSVSGESDKREVVTVPDHSCEPVRFVLTPQLGTAMATNGR